MTWVVYIQGIVETISTCIIYMNMISSVLFSNILTEDLQDKGNHIKFEVFDLSVK